MTKPGRPSFGRPQRERGLDQFDTPPITLLPLFEQEPLLAGVTTICEPFAGAGNLVMAMRSRGLTVYASDIEYRKCPDLTVLDFLMMRQRPAWDCDTLLSNPPYADAMAHLDHAWELGFKIVILLLAPSFLFAADRFERMHPQGRLRRVHILAERLQGMHDARHLAAGGKKAGQPLQHAWFVFDRDYFGPAFINPISIKNPTARMPWVPAVQAAE